MLPTIPSLLEVFVDGVGLERLSQMWKPEWIKGGLLLWLPLCGRLNWGHFDRWNPQSMDNLISSLGANL